MSMPTKIALRERFTTDGAECEIEILEGDHGYRGAWRCGSCGQSGESKSNYAHTTAAMLWARGACQRHHLETH
jgi:hypothetical protein